MFLNGIRTSFVNILYVSRITNVRKKKLRIIFSLIVSNLSVLLDIVIILYLIWNKNKCGSPGLAKYRPMKTHENILLFAKNSGGTYNPIMEKGEPFKRQSKNPEGYVSKRNDHGYGPAGDAVAKCEPDIEDCIPLIMGRALAGPSRPLRFLAAEAS